MVPSGWLRFESLGLNRHNQKGAGHDWCTFFKSVDDQSILFSGLKTVEPVHDRVQADQIIINDPDLFIKLHQRI